MGENIHNHIKEYRLRRDLTQDELAKAVGVSRQSINAIERERYVPSLPLAIRFARFFNCPMEALFQLQEGE